MAVKLRMSLFALPNLSSIVSFVLKVSGYRLPRPYWTTVLLIVTSPRRICSPSQIARHRIFHTKNKKKKKKKKNKKLYIRMARSEVGCSACRLDFSFAREKQDDNIEAAHGPSCISVIISPCSSILVSFCISTRI
jgi:hypothetical protein